MSTAQQVAALEGLLALVEANRAKPRTYAASAQHQPTVAAAVAEAQPELVDVEDIELFDDEIVDLSSSPEAAAPSPTRSSEPTLELSFSDAPEAPSEPPSDMEADIEADFSDVSSAITPAEPEPSAAPEEEPPASSKRARVLPASMSEALAAATEHAEREAPLKTPPPESGPQAASPPVQVPAAARVPTLSAESFPSGPAPRAHDVEPDAFDTAAAFEALQPESATRALARTTAVRVIGEARAFQPRTFIEILDATLRLGRED